jgi:hypothetical protein
MELLALLFGLIIGLILLVALAYALSAVLVGLFMAGYYLTSRAMLLITLVMAVWFVLRYYGTIRQQRQRQFWSQRVYHEQRDIKLQATYTSIVFAFVWIVCFFANWEGTQNFFRTIAGFLFRKSLD